ncbi:hypothetical protein HMPREF0519_0007 [Lentilactobacillus hilgardii DSM 20176 = ATCC 8290]|uniref:Uncharacterized protein n=1 Tax=Lentilactobacillus hilgardii (strain ATCC 8290 / DSM 20176 / CCUG 30140 / JCM 1155 / KCTC 3500 / NBRC 15886 / NCIMB 8040 / NRRL B-1843 / 9) TaxID=1423757 RepID=C0XFJ6_LENH9|nr:hypothetical protein HMPREF0519_0007 [Lentilactobacillus hilgardii DSM 20176 = ATCC 8290]
MISKGFLLIVNIVEKFCSNPSAGVEPVLATEEGGHYLEPAL